MKQQIITIGDYTIFSFIKDNDLCKFNKFELTKEEFLSGDFFTNTPKPIKKCLLYFNTPSDDEIKIGEFSDLMVKICSDTLQELCWGYGNDDEITHYEVFLMKVY